MRKAVAIGILTAVLLCVAPLPANACGCGVLVGPSDAPIASSNEQAIVHWSGDEESMQIMLDVRSRATTGGFIIPTPAAAEVSQGDSRLFDLVGDLVTPQTQVVTD